MGRFLVLLGLVSLVAVVYALLPAEYVPPAESTETVAKRPVPPAPPTVDRTAEARPNPRPPKAKARPPRGPTPATKALQVAGDEEALTPEEEAIFKPLPPPAPPPSAAPAQTARPTWTRRYGRDPGTQMPVLSVQPIKDTLRKFYGNLPKGGRMPARIEIQEILPLSVIEAINVPPESQLTMLGSYDTKVTMGLDEVLKLPDEREGIFGLSVVTPNGETIREYVKTRP